MKPVRVGIVGYGSVGRATGEILWKNRQQIADRTGVLLELAAVCRRSTLPADTAPPGVRLESDWKQLVHTEDLDLIVETIGGMDAAWEVLRSSLEKGKPVVTANKKLLAQRGDELFALARSKDLPIGFEATVAGGVPILRALSEAMTGDRLRAVYGILNGTANYILTQMESSGAGFAEALLQAQRAGYAELDPAMDIDGRDAADKLCILARLAFHGRLPVSSIPVDGIRQVTPTDIHYAQRLDSAIRLVGAAERNEQDEVEVSVRPWLVPRHSMLAKVEGVNNAVFLVGEKVGTQMFYGQGAGGEATGVAVVSDVIEIGRDLAAGRLRAKNVPGFQGSCQLRVCPAPRPVRWYLRLTVKDHPGILARVAEVIARESINIDSVLQEPAMPKQRLSFVITVEPVSEPLIRRALAEINTFEFMVEPALLLRIED